MQTKRTTTDRTTPSSPPPAKRQALEPNVQDRESAAGPSRPTRGSGSRSPAPRQDSPRRQVPSDAAPDHAFVQDGALTDVGERWVLSVHPIHLDLTELVDQLPITHRQLEDSVHRAIGERLHAAGGEWPAEVVNFLKHRLRGFGRQGSEDKPETIANRLDLTASQLQRVREMLSSSLEDKFAERWTMSNNPDKLLTESQEKEVRERTRQGQYLSYIVTQLASLRYASIAKDPVRVVMLDEIVNMAREEIQADSVRR